MLTREEQFTCDPRCQLKLFSQLSSTFWNQRQRINYAAATMQACMSRGEKASKNRWTSYSKNGGSKEGVGNYVGPSDSILSSNGRTLNTAARFAGRCLDYDFRFENSIGAFNAGAVCRLIAIRKCGHFSPVLIAMHYNAMHEESTPWSL